MSAPAATWVGGESDRLLKIQRAVAGKRAAVHVHDPHHQRTPGKVDHPYLEVSIAFRSLAGNAETENQKLSNCDTGIAAVLRPKPGRTGRNAVSLDPRWGAVAQQSGKQATRVKVEGSLRSR